MLEKSVDEIYSGIIVEGTRYDKSTVAFALNGRAKIHPDNHIEIVHGDEFTIRYRIVVVLLCAIAMWHVGRTQSPSLSPKDIARYVDAKSNSVRPLLQKLVEDNLVRKSSYASYEVHPMSLNKIISTIA